MTGDVSHAAGSMGMTYRSLFLSAAICALAVLSRPTHQDRRCDLRKPKRKLLTACNTQNIQSTNPCLNVIPGTNVLASNAVTSVGTTTNQTQCFLNCASQQMVCQQKCSGLQ
jgi:hypothetical protein